MQRHLLIYLYLIKMYLSLVIDSIYSIDKNNNRHDLKIDYDGFTEIHIQGDGFKVSLYILIYE